jgi:hypothetical protein
MALSTYTELRSAVASLLNRTDLSTPIVDWITLCEADIKLELRRTEARGQYTINAQTWTLPAAIGELLSIRLVTGSPSLDEPLPIVTTAEADAHRARLANTNGRPQKVNLVGRKVVFTPTPDTSYTVEVTYVESLTALSDSNPTNTVLAEHPGVYLYGAAIHSAPFLGDDSRLPLWREFYAQAIEGLNRKRDAEKYGANPKQSLPSRTFG